MKGFVVTGSKINSPAPTKKAPLQAKQMKITTTTLRKPSVQRTTKNTVKKQEPKKKAVAVKK